MTLVARLSGILFCTALLAPAAAHAQAIGPAFQWDENDPRIGLRAGWLDAGEASHNLRLLAHRPRPTGFYNPADPGDGNYSNTDLAFFGDYVVVGNYHGFMIYDISNVADPTLRLAVVCPGGQGDVSVFGHLLFMSVQETRSRIDCGVQGVPEAVSPARFRGVRIFDIADLDQPRQVAAVQTCRGSHTHTVVTDPRDDENVYVYVSGTSTVRPGAELAGCSEAEPEEDPNTALFRIEVIRVPLAAPQDARVVSEPRIFADEEGNIAGLWQGGNHGPGTQTTRRTHQCHDITSYPELGLAAGACSGNGILLDIRDPVNPVRIDEVVDPNFAYWHSATFSNDGSKIIFTDEWGGGTAPRCRSTDLPEWGANAIFERVDGRMQLAGYYKLPVPQTSTENCVAHNGSLVPVPGRDIKVQAWYQGGISVFDFTDAANPVEIAYFDRGPVSDTVLVTGGYWSAYWYNGRVYGAEIVRGLDVFELTPSEHLSQNEIDAANLVRYAEFNPQHQPRIEWPASFAVARAYLDQLARGGWAGDRVGAIRNALDAAERVRDSERRDALRRLAADLEREADGAGEHGARLRLLAGEARRIAEGP